MMITDDLIGITSLFACSHFNVVAEKKLRVENFLKVLPGASASD